MMGTAPDDLDSRSRQNVHFRTRLDASDGFEPAQPLPFTWGTGSSPVPGTVTEQGGNTDDPRDR